MNRAQRRWKAHQDRSRQERKDRAVYDEIQQVTENPERCPRCHRHMTVVLDDGEFEVTCIECGVTWGGSASLLRSAAARER